MMCQVVTRGRIFSPLLYQLSYPGHFRHIILLLIDDFGLLRRKSKGPDERRVNMDSPSDCPFFFDFGGGAEAQ